jgi:hypothetical protein
MDARSLSSIIKCPKCGEYFEPSEAFRNQFSPIWLSNRGLYIFLYNIIDLSTVFFESLTRDFITAML